RDTLSLHLHEDLGLQVQGIMVDITDRKTAEENVRAAQDALEAINRDLVRKNDEIQSFYHTLSHELKTPLTSAREFLSLVMEGVAGKLNDRQTEYLAIAKQSCAQLCLCIDDLLDTTRIETGKLALRFKPADLTDVVQRVVLSVRSRADEQGIKLNFE